MPLRIFFVHRLSQFLQRTQVAPGIGPRGGRPNERGGNACADRARSFLAEQRPKNRFRDQFVARLGQMQSISRQRFSTFRRFGIRLLRRGK